MRGRGQDRTSLRFRDFLQRFTANLLRKRFDDSRSVKLDLRQLQSRHKILEEDGGSALDPCNHIRSANSHIVF